MTDAAPSADPLWWEDAGAPDPRVESAHATSSTKLEPTGTCHAGHTSRAEQTRWRRISSCHLATIADYFFPPCLAFARVHVLVGSQRRR